jgi:hypothetical protein
MDAYNLAFAETAYHEAAAEEREARDAPAPVTRKIGFSGLEWSVIALAQKDSLSSLKAPGRIAKALGALFGTSTDTRLADGRLEALRRMAVLVWHKSWAVPLAELRAFKAAGFSLEHYEMLQASVSRGRELAGRPKG